MRRKRAQAIEFRLHVVLDRKPALAAVEWIAVLHSHLPLIQKLVAGHAISKSEAPPGSLFERATARRLGVETRDYFCDGILGTQPPQQIGSAAIRCKRCTLLGEPRPEPAAIKFCKEFGQRLLRGQTGGIRNFLEAPTLPIRPRQWLDRRRRRREVTQHPP